MEEPEWSRPRLSAAAPEAFASSVPDRFGKGKYTLQVFF
jgi:hypothetical protein